MKWKGYGHEEYSWILEKDIDALALIVDFYRAKPAAPKQVHVITFRQMEFQLWDGRCGRRRGHTYQETAL